MNQITSTNASYCADVNYNNVSAMVINYNVAAMTINYNNKLVCDDDKLQLIMIYHIHQR